MPPLSSTSPSSQRSPFIATLCYLSLIVVSIVVYDRFFSNRTPGFSYEEQSCNVMGFNIHGEIVTYVPLEDRSDEGQILSDTVSSEDVVAAIEAAEADPTIKGFLFDIDSPGGSPVAGEEIATAIKALSKPSVAVIRQSGLSAAYWAASATDYIIASANSDVGSIGVTMSYVRNEVTPGYYVQLSSGALKDAGDPDKPLTSQEREVFMRDLQMIHQHFIQAISDNRHLSIPHVTELADGSSMLGILAKDAGLVDAIGGWVEGKKYLADRIGEDITVCWY